MKENQPVNIFSNCRSEKRKLTEYHRWQNQSEVCSGSFISTAYSFSLAGNIIVCAPSQGTNREKYSDKTNIKS